MTKLPCRILFFILILVFYSHSSAQKNDSNQLLISSPEYKDIIENNLAQAWDLRDVRPDSALYYANIAQRLAMEHGMMHLHIKAINYVGIAHRNLSNYSKAFERYLEALQLSEEHEDSEQRGYALINLGNLYLYQTNYQGAIRYFIQGLDQAQSLANKRMVGYCYSNLGRSYRGIGEFGQAELYFQQAIDIRKEQNDYYGQIAAEIDLADSYLRKGDFNRSLIFFNEILGKLDPEDLRLKSNALEKMSNAYLLKKEIKMAESTALEALTIAKELNARFDKKNVLGVLSRIYATSENYANAFQYQKEFSDLNQQLFSEENIRKIEQLKNQHQIEQKEAENEFLRQESELKQEIINRQSAIIVLASLAVLLFRLLALFAFRSTKIRKRLLAEIRDQKDEIQKDKDLIEAQSKKLMELDAAKSRFFANVSHDLRTPLSLILGNIDMLKDDGDNFLTPQGKRNLDISIKNCKRLLYLTDEINDLTKLEEGKINLKVEPVRMSSYLKMLSEMFVGTAEYKGVDLSFVDQLTSADSALIDPRQFEKIFYNLVANAIRHTSKGDEITIVISRKLNEIVLEIRDTGEGIAADSLPYVFDRFYQSKNSGYRSREGLGIGLALVKELIDLHNGKIEVFSEVGEGTTFRMSFPATDNISASDATEVLDYIAGRKHLYDEIDREADRAVVSLPKTDKTKQTILLVDDHPEIRYHIRQILEEDYHVVEAAHGLEALELLKLNKVDILISDLMMPYMDGFELIESISNHPSYSKIPILVVSARISERDQEKVLFKGINDYLQKPFQKKELILRINNLLNQREKWESSDEKKLLEVFDKKGITPIEEDIIKSVEELIMDKIDDPNLSVLDLCETMAASERQVYRLIKRITHLTPHEYITEVKMKYVDLLIRKNKVKTSTEAAKSIGLKNVTTFTRQYEKRFGK
ncbi:MAG: response regulator, partial [Cyclobacteriaceae bacterium]